ncbi:MAG: hypothetical protein KC613_12675, partial [Myxococcales bacterium]|nr:hypothetical protein [Myxococcales bacterium]
QDGDGDWTRWPGAAVGDLIRVIRRPGGWRDDPATGPFADFTPAQKGLPVEQVAGEVAVTAVDGDRVTLAAALPEGDVAYRVRPGGEAAGLAGAPGHGFARVTVGPEGRRMVPHFRAVDLASDNRLPPHTRVTTEHRFAAPDGCATPQVRARLLYRPYPRWLAQERGWAMPDRVIAEVIR